MYHIFSQVFIRLNSIKETQKNGNNSELVKVKQFSK